LAAKLAICLAFWLHSALWVTALVTAGCGYHAVYGDSAGPTLGVAAGQVLVPDAAAVQSAMSGVRAELAAGGRLASSAEYPRVVVDVLRVDELSRGIHVASGAPAAGGMSIGVTIRARLFTQSQQEPSLDSGDVRRAVTLTGNSDPRADRAAYEIAVRSAAERAGKAAARIILGIPEPADESP